MHWGEITWIFFHTLSVKISKEHYFKVKHDLFKHIKQVCYCLPCPMCASHASQYISRVNTPDTKEGFIKFLVDFHNSVNARLNKPIFRLDQVYKYKTVNLSLAFHTCKHVIQKQPYNPKLMMEKIKTRNCFNHLHAWMKNQHLV